MKYKAIMRKKHCCTDEVDYGQCIQMQGTSWGASSDLFFGKKGPGCKLL